MRNCHFWPIFLTILMTGFQNTQAASKASSDSSKTECLGRTVFETREDITWHLLDERWDYSDGTGLGSYSPDINLADKQLSYGSDPSDNAFHLVTIDVTPKTTIDTFNKLVRRHSHGSLEAKKRVIQGEINEISSEITEELSKSNQAKHQVLSKKNKDLNASLERLDKVSSELVLLPALIDQFEEQGRPTDKLVAELKAYQKEFDSYPTDELYAEQSSFDFGMPDAFGVRHPDKLIVLLWRDEHIYRFAFGQQSDYSEHRSSFEKLLPAARDLLARFRTRAEFEIPKETGFCLPFGFIADDGKAHYSITMAWHPTDNPNLLYSLSLSDDIGKALNLLPVLTTPIMGSPFPSAGEIQTFGPSKVQIGSRTGIMGGKYYKPTDPQGGETEATERFVMTAGLANKGYEPSMVLKAQNYASTQVRSFEQSKEDFLNILKSFRLQPGMDSLTGK
ncbi:hypothetical protein PS619_01179 [Pseudomonas fluorescens]|nr:hypothetical protein PS619_01179 [Pseudomonas fluorescens]